MFPHAYTYNPGVVLDPVTMTPMITNGSVTVNPLGVAMRPEQKVWQKMLVKNIPEECPNQIMLKLLNQFGTVRNFKRAVNNRGVLMPFCFFQFETGDQILRVRRLFNNIKLLDKNLELTITGDTENFLKEWRTIQKEQWRKKLLAPSFNEAKEYQSLEAYQNRDDKRYKNKIQDTLKQINVQVKKLAIEKAREDERKQHPKQKQRQRTKKKNSQDLERNYLQKLDYWLKREKDKVRQSQKQKQRERERQKARVKKIQKELDLLDEQFNTKATMVLQSERRKQIQLQQIQDIEILMQEQPPLPEEGIEDAKARIRAIMELQEQVGEERIGGVLVQAPKVTGSNTQLPKELKRSEFFKDWEKQYDTAKNQPKVELQLPELIQEEIDREYQEQKAARIAELEKLVPQNKKQLWSFPINWQRLAKSSALQKNIRPWLQKRSDQYIGGVQHKFIALVEKRLLSGSHPQKIIKILESVLDNDSEEFVYRLWKIVVLQSLKLQNEIQ